MSTEQTRFQTAYTHVQNRRDAVVNSAKYGVPLPKSFIHIPSNSDVLPQGVPVSPGKKPVAERHPILDRDWRRANRGRTIFTGLAALAGLGVVGFGVSALSSRVSSENSYFDNQSTPATNVSNYNIEPVTAGPGLNSVSEVIESVDPGLNLNSATGSAVEKVVAKQLPNPDDVNYIQAGESVNVPVIPQHQDK